MEIELSKFEVDKDIFGEETICGLFDLNDTFINNNLYGIEKLKVNSNLSVRSFLLIDKLSKNKYKLVKTFLKEFEIDNKKKRKKLNQLCYSDFIKVIIIKALANSSKTVVIKNIDIAMNKIELDNVFNTIKRNKKLIKKSIIFSSTRIENVIMYSGYYVIVKDKIMVYSGTDFTKSPIKTPLMEFTDLANEKEANLGYYKDVNDLLKAIYRSVKR